MWLVTRPIKAFQWCSKHYACMVVDFQDHFHRIRREWPHDAAVPPAFPFPPLAGWLPTIRPPPTDLQQPTTSSSLDLAEVISLASSCQQGHGNLLFIYSVIDLTYLFDDLHVAATCLALRRRRILQTSLYRLFLTFIQFTLFTSRKLRSQELDSE